MNCKDNNDNKDPRRQLPSVSAVLANPVINELKKTYPSVLVTDAVRQAINQLRLNIADGKAVPGLDDVLLLVKAVLSRLTRQSVRHAVNGTGVILHTGLGRAVLPQHAIDSLSRMNRYCVLQIDLESGNRGQRNRMCELLLQKITGAESAMIVNNNAAATFLILAALAPGKEVIVSRGQLIEIGGSYRLPDCIALSGAKLVEVGTTNKTHLRDYENAITANTAIVMKVNPSNYRIVGFTKDVPTSQLAELKKKYPIIVVDDLGCGALIDLSVFNLPKEPTVQDAIASGADLVCFSGDKLISGPQAGIIVGKKELIDKIRKHPFSRILRVCKLTSAALEKTLELFLDPEALVRNNPTIWMISRPLEELRRNAEYLKQEINKNIPQLCCDVVRGESVVGGGSLPGTPLATWQVTFYSDKLNAEDLAKQFRFNEPPVIPKVENDTVRIDLRTVFNDELDIIVQAVKRIFSFDHEQPR